MKISIIYSSITGNTKLIASAIKGALSDKNIVYFGPVGNDLPEADIYIIGSWTDKGNGSKEVINLLKTMKNKKIAYFGTAGYKKDKEYYATLFSRVKDNIDSSNEILGYFYCQGKMPIAVRERYVNLLKENPDIAKDWDPKYGDIMIKLVFIGKNMDKQDIFEKLDKCLIK